MNPLLVGGALGAFAMYFLDPREGRRRRARTRDRMIHAGKVLNDAGKVSMRDTAHRAQGVWASTRKLFSQEPVTDPVLAERVRAELGRYVSHSHAIQIIVDRGHVTVSGPILAEEVRPLLRCIRGVPGVRAVSDRLTVHEDGTHVSALQGGRARAGTRFELLQENWSPMARLFAGSFGAGLIAASMRAPRGACAAMRLGGALLIGRAAANMPLAALLGLGDARHGIVVQKSINVDAPVDQVFDFWTNYQNFPRFMHHVREVRVHEGRSHWVVAGPAGVPIQWNAELVEVKANELLRWRSTQDSSVKHEGFVRFERNGHGGTRITVRLSYVPPAGAFGHAVATVFGADPKSEMDGDLLRMKTMIETGRAPHDAAARRLQSES